MRCGSGSGSDGVGRLSKMSSTVSYSSQFPINLNNKKSEEKIAQVLLPTIVRFEKVGLVYSWVGDGI
jgi:hypothetical protein